MRGPAIQPKRRPTCGKVEKQVGKPCYWCNRRMDKGRGLWPTRDHVVPRSQGGTVTVWACEGCNSVRGDMTAEMWRAFLTREPEAWRRFFNRGPRGEALFFRVFGEELRPHVDRALRSFVLGQGASNG